MEQLIAKTAHDLGINDDKVRRGFGAILSVIKTVGNGVAAQSLFNKVPGSETLAQSAAAEGGLLGKMGGGMLGGPLALVSRMQGLGLSPEHSKAVTTALMDHLKNQDAALLRQAASNVSGLNGFL